MRQRYLFGRLIITVFSICVLTGCSKEDYNIPHNNSSLVLQLPPMNEFVQAGGRATGNTSSEAEKKFHYLRILVAKNDGSAAKVYNFSTKGETDIAEYPADGNITLDDTPTGDVTVYAVANEEVLGLDLSKETSWSTLEDVSSTNGGTIKKKLYFKDSNSQKKYPITKETLEQEEKTEGTAGYCGLPMSAMATVKIPMPTDKTYTVPTVTLDLKRMISKVIVSITNKCQNSLTLNKISFGPFMGNKIYLMPEDEKTGYPDIPKDSEYTTYDKTLNMVLQPNTPSELVYYIYPSDINKSEELAKAAYQIGFTGKNSKNEEIIYPMKPIEISNTGGDQNTILKTIKRNQILRLNIQIKTDEAKKEKYSITYSVEPWTDRTVDVPSFD